jgi:hypothetical protein
MKAENLKYHLEELIDKHGTSTVINLLSEIMYEKAAHIRENWQDANTAKFWDANGKAITNVLPKLKA